MNWSGALWRDHLAFRDYLRSHVDIAREYDELKRQLAVTFADDRRAFSEAKGPFIRAVLREARRNTVADSTRN